MNEYVLANLAPPKPKIFPVGPNHLTPFRYCIFMSLKTCVPPPHFLSYRDPCSVGNLNKSKDNKDKTFAESQTIIPIPRQSLVLTGDQNLKSTMLSLEKMLLWAVNLMTKIVLSSKIVKLKKSCTRNLPLGLDTE